MLLRGAAAEAVDATRGDDQLRGDPLRSFERAADEMAAAFREPGALRRVVHHPSGDRSGQTLLVMRVTEFAIHGWDLARAIGADERLEARLVEWLWERLPGDDVIVDRRKYALPQGHVGDDWLLQDRLLHLLGRSPHG